MYGQARLNLSRNFDVFETIVTSITEYGAESLVLNKEEKIVQDIFRGVFSEKNPKKIQKGWLLLVLEPEPIVCKVKWSGVL